MKLHAFLHLVFVCHLCCLRGVAGSAATIGRGALQVHTVRQMISRVTPEHAHLFSLRLEASTDPQETHYFELSSDPATANVVIRGDSGVSLASGFHHYLKYFTGSQYTWQDEQLNLTAPLPWIDSPVIKSSPYSLRYYYNVCTMGYSTAFWTWERWERDIDWAAMNSINLPLAFVGQEYVWLQLFQQLGLNRTSVREQWLAGPAFLPWNRMGNLNNWGGPLSEDFISARVLLQKQILQRQRAFGMTPVLPGFAGFKELFPHANVTTLSWAKEFGVSYFLHADDPLFEKIAAMFLQIQEEIYGTDHYYNADPFNEMTPTSSDPEYLATQSKGIYNGMIQADPDAIWVLQGWFLLNEDFWGPSQTKAFLDAVPDNRLIVLDLWAEISPYWKSHDRFYGKQFIWCMLHDFGGRSGLYAAFDRVNEGVIEAQQAASNMVGIGLTPEAIDTNPVIYDFMMEFAWRKTKHDLPMWIRLWAERRYGAVDAAAESYWQILASDILNCKTMQQGTTVPIFVARPNCSLPSSVGCCGTTAVYYSPAKLVTAWRTLLGASRPVQRQQSYRNDLVQISRQVLGDLTRPVYGKMMAAYNASNQAEFNNASATFLQLLTDIDSICATQRDYLLGPWVAQSMLWGVTPEQTRQMAHNAYLQKTSWGPPIWDNRHHEYAYKVWSGLVKDYYGVRWSMFIDLLRESIAAPGSYNASAFHQQMFAFEGQFAAGDSEVPPCTPTGNSHGLSSQLFQKYFRE